MGTDFEVTFSQLRFIPTRVCVFGKVVELVEYYIKAYWVYLPWYKPEVLLSTKITQGMKEVYYSNKYSSKFVPRLTPQSYIVEIYSKRRYCKSRGEEQLCL